METKIISPHIPKCAGESLRAALEDAFGKGQIYRDYDDSPFNPVKSVNTDPLYFERFQLPDAFDFLRGKRVAYGHFHPNKYRALTPAIRITVLREPVERLVSHYYYWKNCPRHDHPLHDYFLDHNLSLEAFAEMEPVRRFYSGVFFEGVRMEDFDAIGAVEQMDGFLRRLGRLTAKDIKLPKVNTNRQDNYHHLKQEILADTARVRKLRELLAEDQRFYERWSGHASA